MKTQKIYWNIRKSIRQLIKNQTNKRNLLPKRILSVLILTPETPIMKIFVNHSKSLWKSPCDRCQRVFSVLLWSSGCSRTWTSFSSQTNAVGQVSERERSGERRVRPTELRQPLTGDKGGAEWCFKSWRVLVIASSCLSGPLKTVKPGYLVFFPHLQGFWGHDYNPKGQLLKDQIRWNKVQFLTFYFLSLLLLK